MTIVKATTEDIKEILEVQKLAYEPNKIRYNDDKIPPLIETEQLVKEEMNICTIFKAVENGKIIGSVRGYPIEDYCYIGRLNVHPQYQNHGVAHALLNMVQEEIKVKKYKLTTGHLDEQNLGFYTRLGFVRGQREKISNSLYFIHMEKTLS